jgi:hypothetical protein
MKLPQTVLKNSVHTSQITQDFSVTKTSQIMLFTDKIAVCRSQWPRDLRRRYVTARLLRIVDSNPTGGIDVCCECCVLSNRGLCDELITRPEESYRLWCVVVCVCVCV